MPSVSIVIPVYNVAGYLRRCLDSAISQTLDDIEIICVNDASTDDSLSILRDYAERDSRITVIDFSRNRGVSAARNTGIAVARGEYLGFMDSDDAVDLHFYESLYAKAVATDSLITRAEVKWIELTGEGNIHFKNREIQQERLNFNDYFYTGIYRTGFIRNNGICFPVGITNGEDWAFLVKAVSLASSVETVDDVLYYYYRRHDSADLQPWTPQTLESVYFALEDIFSFLNAHDIDDNEYAKICAHYIWMCFALRKRLTRYGNKSHFLSATWAIRLYSMCKHREAVDRALLGGNAYSAKLVILGDLDSLLQILSQNDTHEGLTAVSRRERREVLLASFRSRVRADQ